MTSCGLLHLRLRERPRTVDRIEPRLRELSDRRIPLPSGLSSRGTPHAQTQGRTFGDSLAGDSEVVVSWTTRDLLAGSNIRLESRGHHALKGLEAERDVFRVVS